MVRVRTTYSPEQIAMLRWTARLGAITAEALALHERRTLASARARLAAGERAGLLSCKRVLAGAPALYTVTSAGMRASGLSGLEPCRVSAANAPHTIACAGAAAALECAYPDHRLMGERELRREEREAGGQVASACLGSGPDGGPLLHRPDLVLWPDGPQERLPVAVEVELTVKAPQRLAEICRAWARCHCVAGTLYLVATAVQRPLARAIDRAQADERIVVVALDVLIGDGEPSRALAPEPEPAERTVPSAA
jgi:hypothetical protein